MNIYLAELVEVAASAIIKKKPAQSKIFQQGFVRLLS